MSSPAKLARLTTPPPIPLPQETIPSTEIRKWSVFDYVNPTLLSKVTVANVIAMGSRSSGLFVTSDDEVYSVGSDFFGCLGIGNNQGGPPGGRDHQGHWSPHAEKVTELCGKKVVGLYSGPGLPSSWYAVTKDGLLFGWGDNDGGVLGRGYSSPFLSTPNRILLAPKCHVIQVASGSTQTLALSENGQVFLWNKSEGGGGYNRPKNITTTIHPTATFVYIACGEDHSAAISKAGELYLWGKDDNGQLGGEGVTHLPTPITKVVCSNGYTMALTKAGDLFTWGKNAQGQCGIGNSSRTVSQPMQVHLQETVLDIAASRYSGISVCTTKNQVYFWGTCDGSKFEPVCSPRVSPFETIHQVFASYSPEMMHEALVPAVKKDLNLMQQQSCHQTLAETLLTVFVAQSCDTLDVAFEVQGKHISAHKNILSMRSEYFCKMFAKGTAWAESDNNVVPVKGFFKYKTFYALLYYLYSDKIIFPLDEYENIIDLLSLADFYCEDHLRTKCEKVLIRGINMDNVVDCHCAASKANQETLQNSTFKYMVANWAELSSDGKLEESDISREDLLKLIKAVAEKYK